MEPIIFRMLRIPSIALVLMLLGSSQVSLSTVTAPKGESGGVIITRQGAAEETTQTETAIAHNFVLAVARRGDEIWVGTEKGFSHGVPVSRSAISATQHDYRGGK